MDTPVQLSYCEIDHLFLHPNVTYIFVPIEGCAKCEEKMKQYRKAMGYPEPLPQ